MQHELSTNDMITFPNAKINIGLNVVSLREDGYHDLESVFYPIPLEDALEIIPVEKQDSKYVFHSYGNSVEENDDDNLVVRAYRLLDDDFHLPAVDISLYKHIPCGAGLGGGSADATFTLKMLNTMFNLKLSTDTLKRYALQLGADCPFFVDNKPMFAEAVGELLSPVSLSLKGYRIVVVKPNIFISTREAFSNIIPKHPEMSIRQLIMQPIKEWKTNIKNDFEKSAFSLHAELGEIKQSLYREGAVYVSMSGSGSAIFGIFPEEIDLSTSLYNNMFYFTEIL